MPDLNTLLRSLIERIRSRDFGLEFFTELVAVVWHLSQWLAADERVFAQAATPKTMARLSELQAELTGAPPMRGTVLTNVFVKLVLSQLIKYVLEQLETADLPEILKAAIRAFLESLKNLDQRAAAAPAPVEIAGDK